MKLAEFSSVLGRIPGEIERMRMELNSAWSGITDTFETVVESLCHRLELATGVVKHNDPERQLALGYAIARIDGRIVKKIGDAAPGDMLEIRVKDGFIASEVKTISNN